MIQFHFLNGSQAGTRWVARRFPFRAGRAPDADLRLEGEGVWDEHLRVEQRPSEGIALFSAPNALTIVNGQAVQEALLRNGDIVDLGSVKLQFSLSPTRQHSLRVRETMTWAGLAALCLGQVALVYWLAV